MSNTPAPGWQPADGATGLPPAGWYPDPEGAPGMCRNWDGSAWVGPPRRANRRGKPLDVRGIVALCSFALVPLAFIVHALLGTKVDRVAPVAIAFCLFGLACSAVILWLSVSAMRAARNDRCSPIFGMIAFIGWLLTILPLSLFLLLILLLAATGL